MQHIKFFLFVSVLFLSLQSHAIIDSIGIEKNGQQIIVLHKVDQGETLFSISRRYGVGVQDIKKSNPGLDVLKIGQVVKVPLPVIKETPANATAHTVAQSETLFSISRKYGVSVDEIKKWNKLDDTGLDIGQILMIYEKPTEGKTESKTDYKGKVTHTVESGETLYSISKKYNVEIDQIKAWNNLTENTLSLGQVIVVGMDSKPAETATVTETTNEYTEIEVEKGTQESAKSETKFEKVVESGLAEVIEGTENTRKYLALHKTAPVGTIMQVKNEMNGLSVFVRVRGQLPDNADNEMLILKLSEKAYQKLGAVDKRFRVELVYSP